MLNYMSNHFNLQCLLLALHLKLFTKEWLKVVNNVTTCVLTFYMETFLLNCHFYFILCLQSTIKYLFKNSKKTCFEKIKVLSYVAYDMSCIIFKLIS